jgi:hypothetical protein
MGLRGTVPLAGADLFGAGANHLPVQEGECGTESSCDNALIYGSSTAKP